MYHCRLRVCLMGMPCGTFAQLEALSPPERFTYEIEEERTFRADAAARADVIFANLEGTDGGQVLPSLTRAMKPDAQLILLAGQEQRAALADSLDRVEDVWTLPMPDGESRFRLERWQREQKRDKDFWQTSQYLEAVINSSPNMIWYKDRAGLHEKVNDTFCRVVGKSKQAVEGRDHYFIWDVDPEDPDNRESVCVSSEDEVMAKGRTCVFDETVKIRDETKRLITYKSPLYDLDGSVMGTVGIGTDVTRELAYKQALTEKNHMLESVFTSLDCGVICHSMDGAQILSVNRAALQILGYETQEEMLADGFQTVAMSVLEEDKPRFREMIQSLKEEGDSFSIEYRVRHKDGELRHVMGNVKLIRENGELSYRRFLLDCTDQKLLEEENNRRQADLLRALSIDYDLVFFFQLDTCTGRALRVNEESRQLFDPASKEKLQLQACMNRYIQALVYEEDRETLRRATDAERLRQELAERKLYYVNFRACLGGEIKYYELKAVRTGAWEEGQGVVLGFRSVDDETRSEMEQRRLLETALFQANRANKAKSMFLSNMSHDIRTPMNAIVGFTALATSHIDDRLKVEEYLKKITASGDHLLRLINDVLEMSRIENGEMRMEEKPCSLREILEELEDVVQLEVQRKKLDLRIDASQAPDDGILCDRLRLHQVLINVLGNSVKYTLEGGSVELRAIETAVEASGRANYEFRIKDTGIGMEPEFVGRIFEPFERERNTTTSGIQGTGLGMAITKNLVDMMNGSIEVTSCRNKGTEVVISLTFHLCGSELAPIQKNASVQTGSEPMSGRILLAEDNELNQEIAQELLEDAGFDVDVAENGLEAVEMLKRSGPGRYRLVLMDIQMPVMNGYEAARTIRALPDKELASIPILAMTANAFEEDKQDALRSGMNGHIAKPINISELFDTLRRNLSQA